METVQEIISQLQNAKTTTSSKKDELREIGRASCRERV